MSVVVAMGKFTPVQTEYAIKDHLPRGIKEVTSQIIVGTPGTMIDLIRRKVINVSEVKVFVLDEADDLLKQDGLSDQTLRVKKFVSISFSCFDQLRVTKPNLLFVQHATEESTSSNCPLFRNLPRPSAQLCDQICAKCEPHRTPKD